MNTTSASVSIRASTRTRELPPFNLVLLHDHELAAKTAEKMIARLLAHPLRQTDMHQDQWTFEELAHPQFRKEALELARACDLMLVATVAPEGLPEHIHSWITEWTETRGEKDGAFVFLSAFKNALAEARPLLSELGAAEGLAVFTTALIAPETIRAPRREAAFIGQNTPRPERRGINE